MWDYVVISVELNFNSIDDMRNHWGYYDHMETFKMCLCTLPPILLTNRIQNSEKSVIGFFDQINVFAIYF